MLCVLFFFFSSRRRHTRLVSDWSSDVCSSDLARSQHDFTVACRISARGQQRNQSHAAALVVLAIFLLELRAERGHCEIGRASCRERCRSRWSPYHEKKKEEKRVNSKRAGGMKL